MMRLIFMACLFLVTVYTQAQISTTYPKNNPQLVEYTLNNQSNKVATNRSKIMVDLPFFDDFSYSTPYPDASNWEDRQVYINNTWATNLVSVGVATFDGLDATGSPYGGGAGSSDTLTSAGLNLGGLATAYISYYIQPRGLGDLPDTNQDLILEFLSSDGEWEIKERHIAGDILRDSVLQFNFIGPIAINEARFLYDGFQFRFRNYSSRSGAVDLWHLDYVRVDETPTNQLINDLAFTKLPPSIFKNYTSVPLNHFNEPALVEAELRSELPIELYNHSNQTITTEESLLRLRYISLTNEVRAFIPPTLFDNPNFLPDRQEVGQSIRRDYLDRLERQRLDPAENFQAKMIYEMTPSPQEDQAGILRNDSVISFTTIDDFYAYDDGSAESLITIGGLGGSAAMEFFNYQPDSLRGIQIQIPRFIPGAASSQITLKVWVEDLSTEPVAELTVSPFFVDEIRDTLQAFTTYALKDGVTGEAKPVFLPTGKFFVGWTQGNCNTNFSNCVPIGLDRNTIEAGEKVFLFQNNEGFWRNVGTDPILAHLKGALMLRPILGTETPLDSELATSTNELILEEVMQLYPNPAIDNVQIQVFNGDYEKYQLQIHNVLGQLVEATPLQPQLDISSYPTGTYLLQITNLETRAIGFQKLIKQ